jgi:hypothetical protein
MNVPVHDPWAWVIGLEPNSDIVRSVPDVDDVALDGVSVVVGGTSGTANDAEGVAVEMDRVLEGVSLVGIRLL